MKIFALSTFFVCVSILQVFIDHLSPAGTGLKFCECSHREFNSSPMNLSLIRKIEHTYRKKS